MSSFLNAYRSAFFWGILLFVSDKALAEERTPINPFYKSGEDLTIELVTVSPGDKINNFFGHNFLVVKDVSRNSAVNYNYGTFRFNQEMLPKFIQGRLEFWVSSAPTFFAYRRYIQQNRSIRIQELNLSPSQAFYIANRLAHDVLPENRFYLYHHFYDNCSTRLRDLINTTLKGELKKSFNGPARFTLREHAYRHTQHNPVANAVIDFIMNRQVDKPIARYDEAFLPAELAAQVAEASYVNKDGIRVPLVSKAYTLFSANRTKTPEKPSYYWFIRVIIGLLIALSAIASAFVIRSERRRRMGQMLFGMLHIVFGLCMGLPGLLLFFMSSFTDHRVTYYNENLLLANPLSFAAFFLGFFIAFGHAWSYKWMRIIFYFLAACSALLLTIKILPIFSQDNLIHIALILPINLGFAIAHFLCARNISRASAAEQ